MALQQIILLCIVGILSGIIAGSLGVGGGILIVPALVLLFGFSQHTAQGTSLAVLLPPISIFAVINYHKNEYINYKFTLILSWYLHFYLEVILAVFSRCIFHQRP